MRSLHSALLAAQKSATGRPYIKVEVVEKLGAATRFNWDRLYEGAEADAYNDATMPGDGSLNRIRGNGAIYHSRVVNPGPGSDFSQWDSWGWDPSYDVAISSLDAEVLAFWIVSGGVLRRRESADNGATWASSISMGVITGTAANFRLAACHKSNGDCILLYSNGATLYRRRRISGTWEAAAAWTNELSTINGITVCHMGDWNVIVTGEDSAGNAGVWSCILGDGYSGAVDTWYSLKEITIASSGSNISFHAPSLAMPDVFRTFFRTFFVEKYTGSEAYSRPYWSHSLPNADFISNLWREPIPFNLASDYGLALTYTLHATPYFAWLCRPDAVYRSPITPGSVDISDDLIEMRCGVRPFAGSLDLVLRNDDGRFNDLSATSAVKKGSKINLSLGYQTTAGPKSSLFAAFWIDGWDYLFRPGISTFVLHAHDGWSLLDRWRARRQFTWAAGDKNIFQLLRWLFARAGLAFSSYSYSNAIYQYPAFTINPGTTGLTAVRRLLDMVPDVILFVTDTAYLINPLASQSSAYSYGTDHSIYEGIYNHQPLTINRVQVYGDGLMTEDWDWDDIKDVYDRLSQARDINLETTAKAHERGEAVLRESVIESLAGHIVVPLNCGQDLFDVIAITCPQLGLDASKWRLLALTHTYTPKPAKYTSTLALGAP